jgi:hypothetical protein
MEESDPERSRLCSSSQTCEDREVSQRISRTSLLSKSYSLPCNYTFNIKKHNIRTAYFTHTYLLSKLQNATSCSVRTSEGKSVVPDNFIDPFVPNAFLDEQLSLPAYADSLKDNHIKHCLDYLRQALLCAADSNLEDTFIVNGTSATTGMGSTRICRNFDALKSWSEKWRSSDSGGIV